METEYNDKIHQLIVDRLKERSRKYDFIRDCEASSKRNRYTSFMGWAVAACLVGFVLFSVHYIFEDSTNISEDVIRSGNVNVDELIESKRYDEAIKVMEMEISKSDSTINALQIHKDNMDEESEYELQVEIQKRDDFKKKIEILKKKLK